MAMGAPSWVSSHRSHIWIFNVDRGLAVFIRTGLNQGIIYDFGNSEDFKPSEFLKKHIVSHLAEYKKNKIAQTIISHPHFDHIRDIGCLVEPSTKNSPFHAALHTCPHNKSGSTKPEGINWNRIKNPEGSEDAINVYKSLYKGRTLPLQTICYESPRSIPNLEYGLYYIRPPVVDELFPDNDQEYGNGISLVIYYRHGIHTLLIPADINPETFRHLLFEHEGLEKRFSKFDRSQSYVNPTWHLKTENQPSLKSLLLEHGLSILIAPHHGLKSGFSSDLYESIRGWKPGLAVISEKRHLADTDGEVDPFYQSHRGAVGQYINIEGKKERRYSASTRNGHHVLIVFQGTGGQPEVYLEKNPNRLLEKLR
jgi:hypothetical protein